MKAGKTARYVDLRKDFPFFAFEEFSVEIESDEIRAEFLFNLSGRFFFRPVLRVPLRPWFIQENMHESILRQLFFHIGMIELISYWKAACSPRVIIRPYNLDASQVRWWKTIYHHGLGEFFYTNGLQPGMEDFMEIVPESGNESEKVSFRNSPGYLVPVGGGKDSAVSLEVLKGYNHSVIPFVMNPNAAMEGTILASGGSMHNSVVVYRSIDPKLLELNAKGFLNGHTPFSALLAFNSLLGASLAGTSHIALSNESSANEPTIPGTHINHQYSKSFHFEAAFRSYIADYISSDVSYFSLLRPLNELQIARIFAEKKPYHDVFRSCNKGSKTGSWCRKCPKCLFTWIILMPFLGNDALIKMFGGDLMEDLSLRPLLDQLTGMAREKPFECVGTIDEVNVSLVYGIRKYGKPLPPLLRYYRDSDMYRKYENADMDLFLNVLHPEHFVDEDALMMIKSELP
ncbi:MAG: hypothetical protein R6T99_08050 [Bacteroidales bacterium]